jgi:FkbM family methyltransferase
MNGRLAAFRAAFEQGALAKPEYIAEMHGLHSLLFEYAHLLPGTEVAKIEIADETVIMTSRHGVKILCGPDDRRLPPIEALNFGRYEDKDADMLYRLVRPGFIVFDIGANVGWYAMHLAKNVPHLRVVAFEPIPETFSWLQRNLALNGLENVTALSIGLSDREGELTFYFCPEGSGAASAANILEAEAARQIRCRVRRLDDVAQEMGLAPDFLKCDVEGAELFVFQGGMRCLARSKPVIFCEMLRKWSAKFHYHPNQIIDLLSSIGYRCYEVNGERLRPLPEMTDETAATNFFFLHREKHADLVKALTTEGRDNG